jgi:GNAT superfamily N-acetyltransferase
MTTLWGTQWPHPGSSVQLSLALLYVDPSRRGRGIGSRLLEDFERAHSPQVFTSTNLSNAPMQRLLRLRRWEPCGILNGLDKGDPEIFFVKTL